MKTTVFMLRQARLIIAHAEVAKQRRLLDSERRSLLRRLMRGRWDNVAIREIVERLKPDVMSFV